MKSVSFLNQTAASEFELKAETFTAHRKTQFSLTVHHASSYLGGLVDVDGGVQRQTLRQLRLAAPLQTSELEERGHRQQLHKQQSREEER